ncbi:ABC transporter substrate binding protein [Halodesulfovibrio aestuarii]|uniref:histidine kinase n=1 Tax=Halodesulfovibrio aestuarii TaxID=126333 RepID=A0ABV4JWC3_9BACT
MTYGRLTDLNRNFGSIVLLGTALLFLLLPRFSWALDTKPKNVLLLNSYHLGYLWNVGLLEGMHDVLNRSSIPLRIRYEFMDAKHYTSDAFAPELASLYRQKYADLKFDVIISSDNDSFNFLRRYRNQLFPDTPVVFCGVNNFQSSWLENFHQVTGIGEHFDLRGTMELALRLVPKAKYMVVVGGVDTSSRMNHHVVETLMPEFEDRVEFIDLYGLDPDVLAEKLQQVPRDSVLLYLAYYLTPNGTRLTVQESIDFVYQNSKLPMFTAWSYLLEDGMVGGKMLRGEDQGRTAAQLAMRILKGEKAEDIPVQKTAPTYYMFDYPMLKHFGISLGQLPEDSIVLNLDQSLFERYKWLVGGGCIFIFYQFAVIIGLLITNRKRKKAEQRLRHEESQLEILLEFSHMAKVQLSELLDYALPKIVHHMSAEAGLLFLHLHQSEEIQILFWENGTLHRISEKELDNLQYMTDLAAQSISMSGQISPSVWPGIHSPSGNQIVVSQVLEERASLMLAVSGCNKIFEDNELRDLSLFCIDLLKLIRLRLDEALRQDLENRLLHSHKLEALGTFTSSIAHDFNNILATIASCCEMAMDKIPVTMAIPRSDMRQALKASQRGKKLIRRLLDFSRREPNRVQQVSLCRLAEESLEMVSPLLPADFKVEADIKQTATILGDPDKLFLVIINLLTNSISAMSGKGVLRLQVGESPEEGVFLEVEDNGCGIEPDILDRIFDPFFTTRPKGEGTGLGLSVVDGIIRSHGGSISVKSIPGKGTCFRVVLPLATQALLEEKSNAPEALPMGGDEYLLVVDDDFDIARGMKHTLEKLGYCVTLASSANEALAEYGDGGLFSLVLTDYDMPGMSGLELAQALQTITPDLPVILVTGFDNRSLPADKSTLLAAGVRSIIHKPADSHLLARSIRALLDDTLRS